MPSSLTWIDHDPAARERSWRILALFQEKESRDELGLGGIRDSFADQLFPGTSTIQTRLRYMLFVPWMYADLEKKRERPDKFARTAAQQERNLITVLQSADDNYGVIGAVAGKALKRLPGSIYWAGLGRWGIRRLDLSQEEYHQFIGTIYQQREEQERHKRARRQRGEEILLPAESHTLTWHPQLPAPPEDFPHRADFLLTWEEANFLLDCWQRHHPNSLLTFLARHCAPAKVEFPWEHPERARFRRDHQELLDHARRFSQIMHGAALIYNLRLSELRHWEEKISEYRTRLQQWGEELDWQDLQQWSLERLWELTTGQGHTITPATRRFVSNWVALVLSEKGKLADHQEARWLIGHREQTLKGVRSRLRNRRALEQWRGASGLGRLAYRWPTAQIFLQDLWEGLQRRV
ncbi:MAG: hypothetical protein FJ135_04310 [Deltaproteobacteria bacterium]|nr:hypothetical protein [Deltaproteobacteria bacterium]